MSGLTAKEVPSIANAQELKLGDWQHMANAAIFNTMRILKRINPGDTYYEAYLQKFKKDGWEFFDTYHLLWNIGITLSPKRILEIGSRTGISICQLLSSYIDLSVVEKVVLVDPWDDGFISPQLVRKNLHALNLNPRRLETRQMKSDQYFGDIDQEPHFDFILVDGDHTKAVAALDLDAAHVQLESGGIIVFDDISTSPGECGLIDVWEAFKAQHKDEYTWAESMIGKGVAWALKN